MMPETIAKAETLRTILRLGHSMPLEVNIGFWADVVDPIATMIVRLRGSLTNEERALLVAIGTNAIKASALDQEAQDGAVAVIKRAGDAA